MKYLLPLFAFLYSVSLFAQEDFDHGNNQTYTPFENFVPPIARPVPLNSPNKLPIANHEKGLPGKGIEGAEGGLHFAPNTGFGKTVRYDLNITDSMVNFTGKKRHALAVNGTLPAPTLVFTVGDTALIYVNNYSSEPTSVHWHGVQLPERMDGVSFLTQMPIPPHTTYIYKFPVVQSGTYWYHSHYMLQEQIGLYGVLIFNKRTEPDIPTIPVLLSDWSNTKPEEINRMLHTENDWFSIKKKSTQSYWNALKTGKFGVKFVNEWKRMKAMDISDVYYERFLLNGDTTQTLTQFKAGEKVRLRLVNGSSSTYFWLNYSGGKITVVANDGNDVVPVSVSRLLIAPSETYDLIVTIPENMQYQFLATAEDRSGYASLWLGKGMKMPAYHLKRLKYFEGMSMMNKMMRMDGSMRTHGGMTLQKMDMNSIMYPEMDMMMDMGTPGSDAPKMKTVYTCPMHPEVVSDTPGKCPKCGMDLVKKEVPAGASMQMDMPMDDVMDALNYDRLKAVKNTVLPKGNWRTLKFELTGNMNRYQWSINHKTVLEADKILIHRGENLRIILYNNTMMRHPMHLHGHDFRLLNQYGDFSPLKNVVDIAPMETDTLEFYASEQGDWFFHCHILYHMMSGMGRIFSYANSPSNPEIPDSNMATKMLRHDENRFYLNAENDFAFNGNTGFVQTENRHWHIGADWRLGYQKDDIYEGNLKIGRYLGNMQWLMPYVAFNWEYQKGSKGEKSWLQQRYHRDSRPVARLGFQYTLPWLVVGDASVDYWGHVVLAIERKDIPLTPRLRGAAMVNSDKEYRFGLKYILLKNLAISGNYDNHLGWGAGCTLSY